MELVCVPEILHELLKLDPVVLGLLKKLVRDEMRPRLGGRRDLAGVWALDDDLGNRLADDEERLDLSDVVVGFPLDGAPVREMERGQ